MHHFSESGNRLSSLLDDENRSLSIAFCVNGLRRQLAFQPSSSVREKARCLLAAQNVAFGPSPRFAAARYSIANEA
jgi:hypothetical protein